MIILALLSTINHLGTARRRVAHKFLNALLEQGFRRSQSFVENSLRNHVKVANNVASCCSECHTKQKSARKVCSFSLSHKKLILMDDRYRFREVLKWTKSRYQRRTRSGCRDRLTHTFSSDVAQLLALHNFTVLHLKCHMLECLAVQRGAKKLAH